MVGHPKHVSKALEAGVDIICAQGGEGGGHTVRSTFFVLICPHDHRCMGRAIFHPPSLFLPVQMLSKVMYHL
jgi:hypothetical protein